MTPPPYKSAKDRLSPPGDNMDTAQQEPPAQDVESDDMEEKAEQTTIPKSVLDNDNVQPGDTVTFKVLSVDGDNVTVECMDDESGESDTQTVHGKSATDRMAEEFD